MELKYSKFWLLDLLGSGDIYHLAKREQYEYLRGDELEAYEFWKPNASKSLFYTLEVRSCVRDTEDNSAYIFERHIHTSNTSVNSNNCEII